MAHPPPSEEQIAELKSEHRVIRQLTAASYVVIVRRPKRQEWRRFRNTLADDRKKGDAIEQLFRDCVVYPDDAAVHEMLEDKPALAEVFGGEVVDLAGGGARGEAEKKDF